MKTAKLPKFMAMFLCVMLLLSACSTTPPSTPAPAQPEATPVAIAEPPEADDGDSEQPEGFVGTVTFGVSASITGTNSMVGEYVINGAKLAAEMINAQGGILGHELLLVIEDEVDSLQTAVNAQVKLMENPDVISFFGSTNSSKSIGAMPTALEKRVPMFAGGSSVNIALEENPYVWQVRMTDDKSGVLLAKTASENLGMKNPAIIYSTDSFGQGLRDQTVEALQALGIEVNEKNMYGFSTEEKNFAPIIMQVQNSDVDGLIAISAQLLAAIICQQVEAVGLDIPMTGSSSWASAVCRENAGDSANGWYAVADWTVDVATESGKAFATAYQEKYGAESDMPAAAVYDSILVFAKACEIAGTVTDREAINEAMKQINGLPGAMSTYTYAENHCFSTSQFLTLNADGRATMVDVVSIDE